MSRKGKKTTSLITMVGPVTFWLLVFVAIPLIYVFLISFMKKGVYGDIEFAFTLENYVQVFDPLYIKVFGSSLLMALETTALCILIGYPFAYFIAKKTERQKTILMMLVIIPFLTNSLIRTYGWTILLRTEGIINNILLKLHLIEEPLKLMYNDFGVILVMVYTLLPFMILPLFSSIEKLDKSLLEASKDLGAKGFKTFMKVTLPLTLPGIFAGTIMVFIPTLGYFFIPDLIGGSKSILIGNLIKNQFMSARNWPLGASMSIVLIVLTLVMVGIYQKSGGSMDDIGGI